MKIQSQTTEFFLAINQNDIIQEMNDTNVHAQNVRLMNLANLTQLNKKDKYGTYFNHTSKNGWSFLPFDETCFQLSKQQPLTWYDMIQIYN